MCRSCLKTIVLNASRSNSKVIHAESLLKAARSNSNRRVSTFARIFIIELEDRTSEWNVDAPSRHFGGMWDETRVDEIWLRIDPSSNASWTRNLVRLTRFYACAHDTIWEIREQIDAVFMLILCTGVLVPSRLVDSLDENWDFQDRFSR